MTPRSTRPHHRRTDPGSAPARGGASGTAAIRAGSPTDVESHERGSAGGCKRGFTPSRYRGGAGVRAPIDLAAPDAGGRPCRGGVGSRVGGFGMLWSTSRPGGWPILAYRRSPDRRFVAADGRVGRALWTRATTPGRPAAPVCWRPARETAGPSGSGRCAVCATQALKRVRPLRAAWSTLGFVARAGRCRTRPTAAATRCCQGFAATRWASAATVRSFQGCSPSAERPRRPAAPPRPGRRYLDGSTLYWCSALRDPRAGPRGRLHLAVEASPLSRGCTVETDHAGHVFPALHVDIWRNQHRVELGRPGRTAENPPGTPSRCIPAGVGSLLLRGYPMGCHGWAGKYRELGRFLLTRRTPRPAARAHLSDVMKTCVRCWPFPRQAGCAELRRSSRSACA